MSQMDNREEKDWLQISDDFGIWIRRDKDTLEFIRNSGVIEKFFDFVQRKVENK